MAESDLELLPLHEPRRLHFNWVLPVLLRPRKALSEILEVERPVWGTPLLILSVLAIVLVLVGGPIRVEQAAMAAPTEMPPGFEWWTPDQQQQYFDAQGKSSGPLFAYVFPALGELFGLWIGWVLLGSLLNLGLTLAGSRGSNTAALNLVAWASIPIALRYIVQVVYILAAHRLVSDPGLSGLLTPAGPGFGVFLKVALMGIDLYVLWRLGLMMYGAAKMSNLPRLRAWSVALVAFLLVLVLQSLPGFLGAQISGLNMVRPFFF